jgi:hypothetical protein
LSALEEWHHGWQRVAAKHPERIKLLTYEEMQRGSRGAILAQSLAFLKVAQVAPFSDDRSFTRYIHMNDSFCDMEALRKARIARLAKPRGSIWSRLFQALG